MILNLHNFKNKIYSSIITEIMSVLLEIIAFTHDNIIELRNNKTIIDAENKVSELIKKLKIKYIIFNVSS